MKLTIALAIVLLSLCGCTSSEKSTCYNLGVKFGRCVMMSFKGMKCNPSDDIAIPAECRGKVETDRGIREGGQSVVR